MIDRFYGFRYEVGPNAVSDIPNFSSSIQSQADLEGCFGWVQKTLRGTYVGEARCSKDRGLEFETWIKGNVQNKNVDILVYDDTKIRLHFSHFKIVEEGRDTCFLDNPHKCDKVSTDEITTTYTNGDEL